MYKDFNEALTCFPIWEIQQRFKGNFNVVYQFLFMCIYWDTEVKRLKCQRKAALLVSELAQSLELGPGLFSNLWDSTTEQRLKLPAVLRTVVQFCTIGNIICMVFEYSVICKPSYKFLLWFGLCHFWNPWANWCNLDKILKNSSFFGTSSLNILLSFWQESPLCQLTFISIYLSERALT